VRTDPDDRFTRWYERLTLFRAIRTIMAVATTLVLIGAVLARLVEPDTFTSLGLACWWALTTVTTVGYGDVVPHETAGRLVGALLMLTGLALIPTLTSVVISMLNSKRTREQLEQEKRFQSENAARLERIERRLEGIEP
jgi:voltage-gated potassium channel